MSRRFAISAGSISMGWRNSARKISAEMSNKAGNPQKSMDKPRASFPSERSNSGSGDDVSINPRMEDTEFKIKKEKLKMADIPKHPNPNIQASAFAPFRRSGTAEGGEASADRPEKLQIPRSRSRAVFEGGDNFISCIGLKRSVFAR